jgi:hypothetical protein
MVILLTLHSGSANKPSSNDNKQTIASLPFNSTPQTFMKYPDFLLMQPL